MRVRLLSSSRNKFAFNQVYTSRAHFIKRGRAGVVPVYSPMAIAKGIYFCFILPFVRARTFYNRVTISHSYSRTLPPSPRIIHTILRRLYSL